MYVFIIIFSLKMDTSYPLPPHPIFPKKKPQFLLPIVFFFFGMKKLEIQMMYGFLLTSICSLILQFKASFSLVCFFLYI